MAPAVISENFSDRTLTPSRTLLLSPPSLSSHPEKLNSVLAAHDRNATDIQMLDRLSLSLVSLPQATYDIVLVLLDADNSRTESKKLLSEDLLLRIVRSLKPGGRFSSQDGRFGIDDADERREALFAGLMLEGMDMIRPHNEAIQPIPLRFGKKKSDGGAAAVTSAIVTGAVPLNSNGTTTKGLPKAEQPAGVGFVDFDDNFGTPEVEDSDDEDDELIDEDTLLDEEDMQRPVAQRKSSLSLVAF